MYICAKSGLQAFLSAGCGFNRPNKESYHLRVAHEKHAFRLLIKRVTHDTVGSGMRIRSEAHVILVRDVRYFVGRRTRRTLVLEASNVPYTFE